MVIMFGETSRKSYIKPFGIFDSQVLEKFVYSGKLDQNNYHIGGIDNE